MENSLNEECGIFGILGNSEAATHVTLGLHALQHRGQEGCGIVSSNGKELYKHYAAGLVSDNFSSEEVISGLKGDFAIGHVRYSTFGDKNDKNFQPIAAELSSGNIALAHNGSLTNTKKIRENLIKNGAIFQSTMDSEVIVHLISISKKKFIEEKIIDALSQIEGAYSILILHQNGMIAIRDPHGFRPLNLGFLEDSPTIASETCAFDIIGAKYNRAIKAGEMLAIDNQKNIKSSFPFARKSKKLCIFEYVYFSRPDSIVDDKNVYNVRKKIGAQLSKEFSIKADLVVPVPDSGVPAAIGYSKQAKIPFDLGIIRNHYIGRTFIEPTSKIRHFGVKLKHNANEELIKGKDVILIDDSIVRGTTSKKIVQMMKNCGARKVYMLIASPQIFGSCFYGIDTPDSSDLISNNMTIKEIEKFIMVDKLYHLSIDGLYQAIDSSPRNKDPQYCDACFTNQYPTNLE